jgi:beta-phosphoglucomutase-like phosphatase (HAD superfamily)
MLEALIFDVDGTLADTEEAHRQAFNAAFSVHGLPWGWSIGAYTDLLKVPGGKERISAYIDSLPAPPVEKERLKRQVPLIHQTKTELYGELVTSGRAPLRPGVEKLIVAARGAGLRLAIASTTSVANVTTLLRATLGRDAAGWFSVIGTGDVVPNKKPAADIYRFVLATLVTSPAQCVAFEDSELGVRAAKAAGLFTVATPSPWTLGERFGAADLVLRSLADLAWSPHREGKAELERIARLQILDAVTKGRTGALRGLGPATS